MIGVVITMGKSKRKLNRDRIKHNNVELSRTQEQGKKAFRQKMLQFIEAEEYAEALNVLAEIIEQKIYDPELMYQGANCYFMIGDYDRAVQWLNNTLQFDSNHISARLLLARICILEDRVNDGLAIYDFILEHYLEGLQIEQREDITDILEYYVRDEGDMIRKNFPHITKFMGLENVSDMSCLRAVEQTEHIIPIKNMDTDGEQTSISKEDKTETENHDESVQKKIQQVLKMDTSVMDKIHLLNVFAGGHFYSNEYESTQTFLLEALKLDMHQDETLRNLAILAKCIGEPAKAMEYAAAMSITDFVLLQVIKSKG